MKLAILPSKYLTDTSASVYFLMIVCTDIHFLYSTTFIPQIFIKCMYVPGTVLDAEDIAASKTD